MRQSAVLIRGAAAYGVGPVVALVTAPILARMLGTEGRGQLAAILQPLTLADAFAAFGVPAAATYFLARGHSARQVSRLALTLVAVTASATYVVLMAYAPVVAREQGIPISTLAIIWASVIAGAFIAVRRGLWVGAKAWLRLDVERSLGQALKAVAVVVLALLAVKTAGPYAAVPIAVGLSTSVVVLVLPRLPRAEPATLEAPSGTAFRNYTLLASASAIAVAANARLDQALLPAFGSSHDNGIYAVAATMAEVSLIVGAVVHRNLSAEIASGASATAVKRTIRLGAALALAAMAAIVVLAKPLTTIVFGADFEAAANVARILAIGAMGTTVMLACQGINLGAGRPSRNIVPMVVASLGVVAYLVFRQGGVDIMQLAATVTAFQVMGGVVAVVLSRRSWVEIRSGDTTTSAGATSS